MSILIPVMRKYKLFSEVTVFYVLCVLSYAMLTGVIFQYFETIKVDFYKPDRILLYLIYTGELLFIFLFSPIFVLKQFTAIEEENVQSADNERSSEEIIKHTIFPRNNY